MGLHRRDESVADLVIGNDLLLLIGENGIFLLVSGDNDLDTLLKVRLRHDGAPVAHSAQRGFVDDIGKLRAGSAGGHARDRMEIHILRRLDLAGVDFQNGLTSGEVRQLDRHAAVKAAGARERGVERFGAVRCGEDDDAVVALKAVHFREKLVERLFTLVVAAHRAAAALLADGVDLVDEHDTRGLLLRLAEKIAHLARAHADEHLHELRTGDGEERHVRFTCHGLGKHRLARSRRADKENALRHRRAGVRVLARIMEIVHDLGKAFLRLVLPGDIVKTDAVRRLDIDLGVALSHAEGHDILAAHLIHELLSHEVAENNKDDQRQNER